MSRTIFLVLAASIAVACTKPDPAPQPAPSGALVETSTGVIPPAASPAETVAALPSSSASAAPATSASGAAADCGGKENPCPLQGWMKANINPPMNKNDLPGLAAGLDKIVTFAPPGYTNWASIAKDGAAAARSGDMTATKASCRTCHDQYKQKYKTEMRGRKI